MWVSKWNQDFCSNCVVTGGTRTRCPCSPHQHSHEKLGKDWNPSAQTPALIALLDWVKADSQICCRSGWEGKCQLHESFSSSATAHVFIQNSSYSWEWRHITWSFLATNPQFALRWRTLLQRGEQVLHSDNMPECHTALHSPKDPTGLCSWERIVKNVSITGRQKTFPFWRRALNSAGIAEYKSPVSGYYKDTQAQPLKSSYINIKIPHGGEASFSLTTHLKD